MANKLNNMLQNQLKVSPTLKSVENSFIPSIPQVAKEDPLTSLRMFSNMLVANMNAKSLDEQDEALWTEQQSTAEKAQTRRENKGFKRCNINR